MNYTYGSYPPPRTPETLPPGTRVRYTDDHLRNTDNYRVNSALHWTAVVVECECKSCASGEYLALDEEGSTWLYSPAELRLEPHLRQRHVSATSVTRYCAPPQTKHQRPWRYTPQ